MKQTILIFSGISFIIFLVFQLSKYSIYSMQKSLGPLLFISSIVLIGIGIVVHHLFQKRKLSPKATLDPVEAMKRANLTRQEFTVLSLVADGLSNFEIAERLFIQESTVKSHVSNILLKLDAKRRTEAVKIAQQQQLI